MTPVLARTRYRTGVSSQRSPELDPRMVRTADALLSVSEALLSRPWPAPGGDITGFLRLADLAITAVEPEGGRVATSGGLAGSCVVTGSHLASVSFTFDRLRPEQLGLAAVITDWFTARFGDPFDSGPVLPHSRRWRIGPANIVLDWTLDPEPRVIVEICRDEEITELGAAARAMTAAVRIFASGPRPQDPDHLDAWLARAGVRSLTDEPGQGLVVWTTRRITGHWTGNPPEEVYLTAHGDPGWLDELARLVRHQVTSYLGTPSGESEDPDDGTRVAEWDTPYAQAGVIRSPARGITGIFVGEPVLDETSSSTTH